ncbi:transposase [Streptococcus pneumoniae]|nr:transposase [Streptococcus pneumoniae]
MHGYDHHVFLEGESRVRTPHIFLHFAKVFLARHLKAAEAGEFVTIDALFQAYKKELGRSYTRDAFYQLLKRHGWRNITPRPEHPRKADAQTIVASKNKISIQEDKKAL